MEAFTKLTAENLIVTLFICHDDFYIQYKVCGIFPQLVNEERIKSCRQFSLVGISISRFLQSLMELVGC